MKICPVLSCVVLCCCIVPSALQPRGRLSGRLHGEAEHQGQKAPCGLHLLLPLRPNQTGRGERTNAHAHSESDKQPKKQHSETTATTTCFFTGGSADVDQEVPSQWRGGHGRGAAPQPGHQETWRECFCRAPGWCHSKISEQTSTINSPRNQSGQFKAKKNMSTNYFRVKTPEPSVNQVKKKKSPFTCL